MSIAWWRGLTQPPPWQQPLLPAPQPFRSGHASGRPNDFAAVAFAPMLGFAAGLQQMMPGMGFGLFF